MGERKYFSDLKREVIDAGTCTLCGGCVATCRLLDLGFLSMDVPEGCLLYTSPSPRDGLLSRMPSSA